MRTTPDLGAVFDEHVASEFVTKDIDATMDTMVAEPYVWHVPPMAGASGGAAVRDFYTSSFIGHTRDDAVQASVLVLIGLLDPAGLPVPGAEQAERLLGLAGPPE